MNMKTHNKWHIYIDKIHISVCHSNEPWQTKVIQMCATRNSRDFSSKVSTQTRWILIFIGSLLIKIFLPLCQCGFKKTKTHTVPLISSCLSLSKPTKCKLLKVFLMTKRNPRTQTEINCMYRHCMCLLPTHSLSHTLTLMLKLLEFNVPAKRQREKIYWSGSLIPECKIIKLTVETRVWIVHQFICFWSWRGTWIMENV